MNWLICTLSIGLTVYWGLIALRAWLGTRATPSLPALSQPPNPPASVSIIVPARDEAPRIRQTVEQLLEQRWIDLEVIVVDDQSTDGTRQIVEELVAVHPGRVACLPLTELPAGWLGKCYACWQGSQRATGEWLLFCDGDVHMSDDVVARAVAKAEQQQSDHLTLLPNLVVGHWLGRLTIVGQSILFLLYTAPERINRDRGRHAVGIGAFNLIRRSTYDVLGGHRTLRLQVVDDLKLGQLVRDSGCRQRVYSGLADIQADWAQTARGVIRALEKNWFAAIEYRWDGALAFLVGVPLSIVSAATGPLWAGVWGWPPLLALGLVGIPGIRIAKDFRWPWYIGWFSVLGWFVFVAAGANSVWTTARQGGIWWRDRFYSLNELRRANRS